MSDDRQRLTAIDGQPPDLAKLPPGCAFAPRCPRAFDRCLQAAPPELALGDGRTARCWLATPALGAATAALRREAVEWPSSKRRGSASIFRRSAGDSVAAPAWFAP